MTQIVVKRPPRAMPPETSTTELRLEAPPELPRGQQEGMAMQLLPMLGMGSSVVFFFMPGSQPFMKIMGVMMLMSTVAMAVAQMMRYRKGTQGEAAQGRRDYLKYLGQTRRKVRRTARTQREAQFYLHPDPDQLWSLVAEGERLWERRITDDDFGQVRVGLGPQQLWTPLVAPTTAPVEELEPLSAGAMHRFLAAHGSVDRLPMAVSLRAFYHVVVSGDPVSVRASARAMVSGLVALHSPEDLVVAVVASTDVTGQWDWTKWLPHTQAPGTSDGAGTKRLFSDDLTEVETLLHHTLDGRSRFNREGTPLLDQPHVVLVLDGGVVPQNSLFASVEGLQGVTVVEIVPEELDEPRGGLHIAVRPGRLRLESASVSYHGTPDLLPVETAEALGRQLAPFRMGSGGDDEEPLLANLDFTDLLGIGDPAAVDTNTVWRPRSTADRLRVPIGVGEDGSPVMLDLKEAAQEGMGPHGLCVGATGSGKSELLRTLVLGLAVTHSSETLNFVLADFKGGATFAGMSELPHVAAVITNLADDLTLVDRMRDSITGELQRRQELLRAAGNYANLTDYEKARAAGAPLEPLASLVLVIDEFSELLTAKPDFIDMFIQIGRIGRSLGVHLLLASQRLEEGRLRGLDTYLSYRIGLRTFSAAESRTALGVPDAYHLPSVPGSGFLKFGTEGMTRFKAAYVSGTYRPGVAPVSDNGELAIDRRPVLFTAAPVPVHYPEPEPNVPFVPGRTTPDALADTVLDVIARRLEGQGPLAHQVWLPPLTEAPSLDRLLPPLAVTPERGLHAPEHSGNGALVVPFGLVDKPFEQRRDTLVRDFSGAAGHMLIVGGPRSGKSTLVRSLISAFALTHTPHEVQFYGMDFGGGGMVAVDGLPHVGGVASRLDPEKIRRTVAEVAGILNRREAFFRDNNIDSIATYRRLRAAGRLPGEAWGDVFLVIDGWQSFKTDYEFLEPVVADIAARGLGLGVHLVATVSRYMEMRAALKDQLLNRLELRLGDPTDSELDRKVAKNVPVGTPGRGLTAERLHFMGALPRIDDSAGGGGDDLSEATAAFVKAMTDNWPGPHAPAVRMLPRMLAARDLPTGPDPTRGGLAIGIDEMNLAPVYVDFDTDPLFAVFGESESGKTALLRLLIKQITARYTPQEALICVGDYRRSLLEVVPEPYLVGYATTQNAFESYLNDMNTLITSRTPGPDVTPQQLRTRSWWRGPRAFIIVDDYDLVATSSANPLAQLVDNLPFARDTGVNFIIARSSAGAGRSSYEPFIQRFKELGAQGVILSGHPNEGELLGSVKGRPLPPGRGMFVARRGMPALIQTGWLEPEEG